MAARRGKSQARRNTSSGLPGWAWLVIGVLVTLLVVLAVPRLLKGDGSGDGFLRIGPKPNPDALPATVDESGNTISPDVATTAPASEPAKPKSTQFDFYDLLPGKEVEMSDAELAASAKAETDAATRVRTAQQTASGDAPGSLPNPIGDTPPAAASPAATAPAGTADAATVTSAANPAAAKPDAAASDARYVLQAGAFGASGDAETVKAKIAMLGLNARVESAQIGGKTVYRVRMGPYGSASELAEAKAKLAGGGLPAMAVKTN